MTNRARQYYRQNRLPQLRGFCYAVQSGSISKAAERLSLSQPTVSLQVQALERELDTILFERRGPRLSLTPDGAMLFELAVPLVEGIDALPQSFAERRGVLDSGEVNVTAGEATILYLLPDLMRRFTQEYPGIRVRFHNVPGRTGLGLLRRDEVDLAVGSFAEVPDDIAYHPLFSFEEMLITPEGHPLEREKKITLADISQFAFILPPRHLNTQNRVERAFQQQGLQLQIRIEAGGWEVIKSYVSMGLGISIVSGVCLTGGESLVAKSLSRYFPRRTYGIVLRRGKFLSPQSRRFIEFLDPDFFKPGRPRSQR